jgi:lipoprotein-anchoring transpeptidase ErfK/SrfK
MVATAEPPVADSYGTSTPAPSNAVVTDFARIDTVIQAAEGQIEQGQHYEALLKLSFAYNAPGMSAEENQKLRRWLDPLAAKVIYSNEHLIGAPYQVQAGETLQSIATKHSVPWQLLANINGLRDPAAVQPGMSIKVVPGPFHADVDTANNTLTLFAGRLYAGQFAIIVNSGNAPKPGEYQVNDKQPGHSFYAGNAQTLAPKDPQNPFGGVWIDLGDNISIHSTSSSPGQSERNGCISLAAKDANDLYGILSVGSNVIVR